MIAVRQADRAPAMSVARTGDERLGTLLWGATLVWIVGTATVFPIGNEALDAISVFTFDRLAFLVVLALLALTVVRRPSILRQADRLETIMAAYLAIVLLSWLSTASMKAAVDLKRDANLLLGSFLMPYAAFLIPRHCGWTRRQVQIAFVVTAIGVAAFLVAVGFVQALVDWTFLVLERYRDVHSNRARGTFPNAVDYAYLLGILLPVVLMVRVYSRRPWARALLLVCAGGVIEALLFSRLRVIWMALPLALLYLAAVNPPIRRQALLAALALLTVIALAALDIDLGRFAEPTGAVVQRGSSVAERMMDGEPIFNRVAVYATALNMIAHRPLLGFGFGAHTFQTARDPYLTSCCGVSPDWAAPCAVPHNEVLNVLVLVGLVGLLAYGALIAELWRHMSQRRRATADAPTATAVAAVQACLVMLILAAQLHDVMYLTAVQVVFFFFAGLVLPAAVPASREVGAR